MLTWTVQETRIFYLPVGVPEVSAVASKNDALNETLAISFDRLLLLSIGESTSPSAASCARFSRSRLRFRDLFPDKVFGVFSLFDDGVSGCD